jgi:putative methionine-R-sulfoxide reductase with GAF domain
MDPETLLSRISEIAAEQKPRMDRLQRVAATLGQSAGYRWVGLYAVDVTVGEVKNLVLDGPAAPEYPN